MKKTITALLTLVIVLIFISSASAVTYVVRKGDSLTKIARKYPGVSWQKVWRENLKLVKKPDHIQVGWPLQIPVKVSVVKSASSQPSKPKPFYWNNIGADPVMNYFDHDDKKCVEKIIKVINDSPLSALQKERLAKAIKEKAKRALRDEDFRGIKEGNKFPCQAILKNKFLLFLFLST